MSIRRIVDKARCGAAEEGGDDLRTMPLSPYVLWTSDQGSERSTPSRDGERHVCGILGQGFFQDLSRQDVLKESKGFGKGMDRAYQGSPARCRFLRGELRIDI